MLKELTVGFAVFNLVWMSFAVWVKCWSHTGCTDIDWGAALHDQDSKLPLGCPCPSLSSDIDMMVVVGWWGWWCHLLVKSKWYSYLHYMTEKIDTQEFHRRHPKPKLASKTNVCMKRRPSPEAISLSACLNYFLFQTLFLTYLPLPTSVSLFSSY